MKNNKLYLMLSIVLGFISVSCILNNGVDPRSRMTSSALPAGMKLVWHDEFNDRQLDRSKWFTQYYSQLDYINRTNREEFLQGTLPEPGILFTDSSIVLITNDSTPDRPFMDSGRKVSSIQTYDWLSDSSLFDNSAGGFLEARIRRSATADAKQVNAALWLDSPGPDARYFMEKGYQAWEVTGLRPHGQLFEIDLCEYITTEIVLHGNVSPEGEFEGNIGHHIVPGNFADRWVVHSLLWTPAGLKCYVDGLLVREWWDPHDIKSPNHLMNLLLGAYGNGGEVKLEADYVRFYQWDLTARNQLPNANFEYEGALFPWEGKGRVAKAAKRSGSHGLILEAGETIYQMIYLDHSEVFTCSYWGKGNGSLKVMVENLAAVTGRSENRYTQETPLTSVYSRHTFLFATNSEEEGHKRTVKISCTNTGEEPICLDDFYIGPSWEEE